MHNNPFYLCLLRVTCYVLHVTCYLLLLKDGEPNRHDHTGINCLRNTSSFGSFPDYFFHYFPLTNVYSSLPVSVQELIDREELFAALRSARDEIESLNQELEAMEVPPLPFR